MSEQNLAAPRVVAPDAVRVWRGFRLPSLALDAFMNKLGTVFVPATVKMQIDAGLCSYAPTVPAGLPGKPDSVPDETAILFWESQATYWNGFTRLAVRTYTLTHGGVYLTQDNQSRADFPVRFAGSLAADQPVYLFDQPADWMHGAVRHVAAARPAAVDPASFRASIAKALTEIRTSVPLDGAIACAGDDYLVYWELGPVAVGAAQGATGVPLLQPLLTGWNAAFAPAPTFLPIGLWDEWAGMDVCSGSSFNLQFEREARG
ncbi:hypothetical protein [Burkholderia alba]|uniref:hypothetical protein n=1 Tax=Burkholderia alba TaxID=2683677 RepID=UPI002B05B825|nr:hypothetical protein [Burkholderia alba]